MKQAVADADVTVKQANETVRTANVKTREQVDRVNGMVTSALDATERFGKALQHGITQPGREIAGFVNGAKSTIDHLMTSSQTGVSTGVASLVSKVSSLFAKKVNPVPGQAGRVEEAGADEAGIDEARANKARADKAGGGTCSGSSGDAIWFHGGDPDCA